MYFARVDLKLSQYDVSDMELKQFYRGGNWTCIKLLRGLFERHDHNVNGHNEDSEVDNGDIERMLGAKCRSISLQGSG